MLKESSLIVNKWHVLFKERGKILDLSWRSIRGAGYPKAP